MQNYGPDQIRRALYCHECHHFAKVGDLEGLLRAREGGCPWDQAVGFLSHRYLCTIPALGGDSATLRWLREQGCPELYWQDVIRCAAQNGHAEVVSWACAQGLPMDATAPELAASKGQLQALQQLVAAGCPWDPEGCRRAAKSSNHLGVADWIEWSEALEVKEPGEA